MELIFLQSGGIFEATRFAAPCEASRSTILNYLRALEETHVVRVVRPIEASVSPARQILPGTAVTESRWVK